LANNYTSFSAMLPLKTKEEREWVEKTLAKFQSMFDDECGEWPKWMLFWKEFGYLGFDTEMRAEGLWIGTEESGVVDLVAEFVRAFLHEFHPDKFWKMTWACTCSKPRVDEFDGGALMVTANTISFMNSYRWFNQMKARTKRTEL